MDNNLNKNAPVVSMIIPIYNVEKWLVECLETCVNQNVDPSEYEIICVDDGSTDNCGKIVDEYAKKYPQIVAIHKENGGSGSARNEGISRASGDYLWFIDGDDFIKYNCLKDIIDCLVETKPDMLFVKILAFNDGEDTTRMKNGEVAADKTSEFYSDWLPTRLSKRKLITSIGIRFNLSPLAQDNMFFTELDNYIEKKEQLDKICYFYRHRENSAVTTPTLKKINKLIETCNEFKKFKQRCPYAAEKSDRYIYGAMISIMSNLAKIPAAEANVHIKKLKEYDLYPLKRNTKYDIIPEDYSGMSFDNKVQKRLNNISYTRIGYNSFRAFRLYLKIKRKIVK